MATARGTLTLVTDHTPRPDIAPVPKPTRGPDPILDAAIDATGTLEAGNALGDAVETALERMHQRPTVSLTAILADIWRAGAVHGYQAACTDRMEAGIADALADVTPLHEWAGGEPA